MLYDVWHEKVWGSRFACGDGVGLRWLGSKHHSINWFGDLQFGDDFAGLRGIDGRIRQSRD